MAAGLSLVYTVIMNSTDVSSPHWTNKHLKAESLFDLCLHLGPVVLKLCYTIESPGEFLKFPMSRPHTSRIN